MFTNASSGEVHLRVVFHGPGLVGKRTILAHLHASTSAARRGDFLSGSSAHGTVVFFDFTHPELDDCKGRRIRLHAYALTGKVSNELAFSRLLKDVDAVVFVADAQDARREANIESFERLARILAEQGRSLAQVPHVLCATKCDLPGAVSHRTVLGDLGRDGIAVNGRTGEGVEGLLARLIDRVRDGRFTECSPEDEERLGRESVARSRLAGHYSECFGRASAEMVANESVPARPQLFVAEHPPTETRALFTYATLGLSLSAQRQNGLRVELLAYSAGQDRLLADVLMKIGQHIQREGNLQAFDVVQFPKGRAFELVPATESEQLLRFPDTARRDKDVRFLQGIAGAEPAVRVTFLEVRPVEA